MTLVFIHNGYSAYLEFTLRQARAADPEADLVLLGDAENDRFPFLRHVDTARPAFRDAADRVAGVYRHRSTNARAFELLCFQRWFVLRAFLEAEGLAEAFVLDSDVMLYASAAEMASRLEGKTLGLARPVEQPPYHWLASAHVSYWTAGQAAAFCDFVLRSYTEPEAFARYEEKWQHHLQKGLYGGICDMTALYLFEQDQDPGPVANLLTVHEGCVHDRNLNFEANAYDAEYRTRNGLKDITWDDAGRPWGFNRRRGTDVRFQTLHLQGSAKQHVPQFYRGEPFQGQSRLRQQIGWHYRMRRAASTVAQPARMLTGKLKRRTS
ncbi:MAG: hypothetical protein R3181_04215 [Rubricoccaceae bacterium]|nr:hypothetical protein [Rubricoccaceae bacterium]